MSKCKESGAYYVIVYQENARPMIEQCSSFKIAVDEYRMFRRMCGDAVRLLKVVVDYGEEI